MPVHMKLVEIFWDDAPYVVLAIAAVGTWWRYRYDKFGWTTRSSQIYESKLLSIGSPLFHFGSLMVIMGHVMGLFVPESWTRGARIERSAIPPAGAATWRAGGLCGRHRHRVADLPAAH